MRLLPFLLASCGAFALCHYFWIPALERRLRIDPTVGSIRNSALLAVAGFLRGLLLITIITTAAIIVIVWCLQLVGGTTLASVGAAINTVQQWRAWLVGFGPVWGAVVLVLTVAALGLYARRRGRQRMEGAFNRVLQRELQRLEQEREQGRWEELPPTSDMQQLQGRILEADDALCQLSQRDPADAQVAAAQQQLTGQLQTMLQYHQALDVQRRIKLQLDPEEAALPAPRTRWEKAQTFFMSRGLLASLGAGSRVIFLASFILLVPSLMGVYAAGTGKMLDSHVVKLQELRVQLDQKEWDQAKEQLGVANQELTAADKETLQQVAQAYERALPAPVPAAATRALWYTMRASSVRQVLLTRAVQRAPSAWEQHLSGSQLTAQLSQAEREILLLPEQALVERGPLTPAGKRMYAELEDVARRSPTMMEKLRTGINSFQKPANAYDLSRLTLTHISSTLTGVESSELGNLLQSLDVKFDRGKFRLVQQDSARQFLFNLMGGGDLASALDDVSRASGPGFRGSTFDAAEFQGVLRTMQERLPIANINNKLGDYPPSVDVRPEPHVKTQQAAAKVKELRGISAATGSNRNPFEMTDALASYPDHFPGQYNADQRTIRAAVALGDDAAALPRAADDAVMILPESGIGGGGGGGGGGRSGGGPSGSGGGVRPGGGGGAGGGGNLAAARGSFTRARSFGLLRGFSRVGGVLIGREPAETDKTQLDCTDLRWEIAGQNVRLILVTADGKEFRSRPHRMTLVYQALNYAADGRPLAVTMATAEPLPELKILLHPTLVDTPLGRRVIELDRFVDVYTGQSEERRQATERVNAHAALYRFAWAQRLLAALEPSGLDTQALQMLQMRRALTEQMQNPQVQTLVAQALLEPQTIGAPELSPLTVKKEFYEEALVAMIRRVAKPGMHAAQFGAAIAMDAGAQFRRASDQEALGERWIQPPPRFEVWSGVREREFTARPENILALDGAALPAPFDFMLQTAFTTAPVFGAEAGAEGYSDAQPWEFPALKNMIQQRVTESIAQKGRGNEQIILDDVSEFAILQRLFRMAFNNQLGPQFPVEKLAALGQATEAAAPKPGTRTLRWNARPGALEMMGRMGALGGEEQRVLKLAIELRRALGVAKDDEQIRREQNAPLPRLDQ